MGSITQRKPMNRIGKELGRQGRVRVGAQAWPRLTHLNQSYTLTKHFQGDCKKTVSFPFLQGSFMFKHKKTFSAISQALGLGIATAISVGAFAQPATTEKTVVTGSNVRSVLEEQTLPVVVITREEIQKSGSVNIEQIVQALSASASAGATTGSMLAGNATYGASTASLRGLGAPRTLVLLNGKRST